MTSVRLRLLVLALLPLVVLLPLFLGITMMRWIDKFDDLLIAKVASDLRVAEQYFQQIEAAQGADVAALAQSVRFVGAQNQGPDSLQALLATEQQRLGLDFLFYLDDPAGDPALSNLPVLANAQPNVPTTSLSLLEGDVLARISPDLATAAIVPLVPTEAARAITRQVESRGMVILAVYRPDAGTGVMIGGRLLNRNLDIIDTMNDLIYRQGNESLVRVGTTTLFLDDVRISTNVRLFEGARALGTRVSEVVWQQVMQDGNPWLDRAFVVNDWYISGYVPLNDSDGTRIGMLYTGFLEAPFTAQRNTTIISLVLAFVAVVAISVPIFLRVARDIFSPLEEMTQIMAQAETGALDARIGPIRAKDEIGAVARHLDRLLDQVQDRDETLRGYADNLNDLVDQRTEELREANKKLEATFAQLILSEKLASLGEITAGVAHEINNPVAVIQGNLEVLRAGLPEDIQEDLATELDLIDAQTDRINIIVSKLLNFTRPNEMSEVSTQVDVAQAVEDALVLVVADLRKSNITLDVTHSPAPKIQIVETELAQVLVNLFINASQAMPDGGVLTITTAPENHDGQAGAAVRIKDNGKGISHAKIDQVFDPFFSTKPGEGSGLGLSISQALIARADGLITVNSIEGHGAEFFIWCPAADNST